MLTDFTRERRLSFEAIIEAIVICVIFFQAFNGEFIESDGCGMLDR